MTRYLQMCNAMTSQPQLSVCNLQHLLIQLPTPLLRHTGEHGILEVQGGVILTYKSSS